MYVCKNLVLFEQMVRSLVFLLMSSFIGLAVLITSFGLGQINTQWVRNTDNTEHTQTDSAMILTGRSLCLPSRATVQELFLVAQDASIIPDISLDPVLTTFLSLDSSAALQHQYNFLQRSMSMEQQSTFNLNLTAKLGGSKVTCGGVGVVALALSMLFDQVAQQVCKTVAFCLMLVWDFFYYHHFSPSLLCLCSHFHFTSCFSLKVQSSCGFVAFLLPTLPPILYLLHPSVSLVYHSFSFRSLYNYRSLFPPQNFILFIYFLCLT